MTKKIKISSLILLITIVLFWLFAGNKKEAEILIATAVKGPFEITIQTSGELQAKNSVEITGPSGLRAASIWQVQIAELVDEGTKVKKGEFVGSLDKSEIATKTGDAKNNLVKAESQYTQTRMDTTIELRELRKNIISLDYDLKEEEITLEQSQYEPPAAIRKAEINVLKARSSFEEAKINYDLKVKQAKAKMSEVSASLAQAQQKLELLTSIIDEFTIEAPEDGMVIYKRNWDGSKKTIGSQVSTWDPVVATLPDLSVLISKTYVNEVDIRKVSKGQSVAITLDAFPEMQLKGEVIGVANVGEQKKGSDAKVFAVDIQIETTDSLLRPGMTTGNKIIAEQLEDTIYIPLECIHNAGDSVSYVFSKTPMGSGKQQIEVGPTNEDFAVVKRGLKPGDELLLSKPTGSEDWKIEMLTNENE